MCAASNGSDPRNFKSLTDNDFASCASVPSDGDGSTACEDLTPTTQQPVTGSGSVPRLVKLYFNQTAGQGRDPTRNVYVSWSISADITIVSLTVTCRPHDSPGEGSDVFAVTTADRQGSFVIEDREPSKVYTVCLDVKTATQGTISECANGITTTVSTASLSVVLSVAIGCSMAFLLVVAIVVWCCVTAAKRRRANALQRPPDSTAPKRSGQTKRFRKQHTSIGANDRYSDGPAPLVTDDDLNRALVTSVERLDPQSKDILANLLRGASTASLDRLGSRATSPTSNYQYSPSKMYEADERPQSGTERNVYEELPDDTYDTIPTDATV